MARAVVLTAVDAQPNECALSAPLRVTVRQSPLLRALQHSLACRSLHAVSRSPAAHAVRAQWEFTIGEALPGASWEVTYVVDAAEHQRLLPLGRTPRTDYAAGACAAEFTCDTIDVAGVPQGCVRRARTQRQTLTGWLAQLAQQYRLAKACATRC